MPLNKMQITQVESVLIKGLRNKFQSYKPEPASMPFHTRLLGKDRLALYSFIHSLNTNFGTSIFEPVALVLAKQNYQEAETHVVAGNYISKEAHTVIQKIMDDLTTAKKEPDKEKEIETIRKVCKTSNMQKVKPTQIDLLVHKSKDELFLFDIKTAKPNAGGFKEFKRTLLEWVAAVLASNPSIKIHTLIAIPYNPYEPDPYNRWTMRGMLDLDKELKVASEFWDFLGGKGAYEDLLGCFERVGIELRSEIDQYFIKYNR
ncbi:MAG: TdeIII family type II restriction endonuclease [Elusimicrobiota bacterium]